MVVSGVGGFLFAEFRNERGASDLHSMRDDINAKGGLRGKPVKHRVLEIDGRSLSGAGMAATLRLFQEGGVAPLTFAGGAGAQGNELAIPATGVIGSTLFV